MILFLWVSFIQKENDFLSLFSPRKKHGYIYMHTYTHVRCVKHFCCILLATTIITMLKISMNEKEKEEWKNKNYEKTRKSCLLVCRFVFLFSFHFLLFQAKLFFSKQHRKRRNNTEAYRLFLSFFITTLIFGFCFGKTKKYLLPPPPDDEKFFYFRYGHN